MHHRSNKSRLRRLRGGLVALGLLTWPLGAGCSLVFDGEVAAVRCHDEGAFGPPACPPKQVCQAGVCRRSGDRPLGAACERDENCAAGGFCLDPATIGKSGPPFCSKGCCASEQCGPAAAGLICWPGEQAAGSVCLQAIRFHRGNLGAAPAGSACDDRDECRSGVCAKGLCIDVCCSDASCAMGSHCQAVTWPSAGRTTWLCAAPTGSAAPGDACGGDDECATGACIETGNDNACATPCCSSASCGSATSNGDAVPLSCAPAGPDDAFTACVDLGAGSAAVGAPCENPGDCASGQCLSQGTKSLCTDVCCSDADCGDEGLFRCRPVTSPDGWGLRCVPN